MNRLMTGVRRRREVEQGGFTIIELLIATTMFSLVLLMATAGILHLTRQYFRGTVQARTQGTARAIIDEIAESIRYGAGDVQIPTFTSGPDIAATASDTGSFCIGLRRYSFAVDRRLVTGADVTKKERPHVIWVDEPGTCVVSSPANAADAADLKLSTLTDGRELVSENMRITRLSIEPLVSNPDALRVELGVAYGIDDDLEVTPDGNYKMCKPGADQSDFCAVSNLSVVVSRRLSASSSSTGVLAAATASTQTLLRSFDATEYIHKIEWIEENA